MRPCIILLSLFVAVSLSAQRKVSELLAKEKLACDSMMQVQYGSLFSDGYFVLDSTCGGNFDSYGNQWNQYVEKDSASYYYIAYFFRFPGARIDSFTYVEFTSDSNYLPRAYGARHPASCIQITQPQMNSIAGTSFGDSLSSCTVRMYDFSGFGDSLFFSLDSSHVFLEVEHDVVKYFGIKDKHYKLWRQTVIVDACTGLVISRSKDFFKVKNWREEPGLCGMTQD